MNRLNQPLLAGCLAVSLLAACAGMDSGKAKGDDPRQIVTRILRSETPKDAPFVILTAERLKGLAPLLSSDLLAIVSTWIKYRDQLSEAQPSVEGAYNPILIWRYNPDSVSIVSGKEMASEAIVRVDEILNPSQIYSGYEGTDDFLLRIENGSWKVQDVKFVRTTSTVQGKSTESFLLSEKLEAEIKKMRSLASNAEINRIE